MKPSKVSPRFCLNAVWSLRRRPDSSKNGLPWNLRRGSATIGACGACGAFLRGREAYVHNNRPLVAAPRPQVNGRRPQDHCGCRPVELPPPPAVAARPQAVAEPHNNQENRNSTQSAHPHLRPAPATERADIRRPIPDQTTPTFCPMKPCLFPISSSLALRHIAFFLRWNEPPSQPVSPGESNLQANFKNSQFFVA